MTTEGVDWVATGPSPAELRAAGKHFALRYLDRHDYPLFTAAEAARLHAAGIDVGCIAEWGSQRMLGGATAGAVDGRRAKAALAALGAPAGTVVYFAADWNAQAVDFPTIDRYLDAVAAVIGRAATGIYGGLRVIRYCQGAGSASHFWQTYAWSGTPTIWATGTHLRQYQNHTTVAGHTVDLDRAMVANWGQWPAVPLPDPVVLPTYTVLIHGGHADPTRIFRYRSTTSRKVGELYSATVTATRSKYAGAWWYRIVSASGDAAKYVGRYFQAQPWMTVTPKETP